MRQMLLMARDAASSKRPLLLGSVCSCCLSASVCSCSKACAIDNVCATRATSSTRLLLFVHWFQTKAGRDCRDWLLAVKWRLRTRRRWRRRQWSWRWKRWNLWNQRSVMATSRSQTHSRISMPNNHSVSYRFKYTFVVVAPIKMAGLGVKYICSLRTVIIVFIAIYHH